MTVSCVRHKGGFTLLELVVVMALISLMFSVTLPRFSTAILPGGTKQIIRTIILKIKALKENSQMYQRTYTLHVDMATNSLWASHDLMSEEELKKEQENALRLPANLAILDVEYPGKTIATQGDALVEFYGRGYSDLAIIHLRENDDAYYSFFIEPFLSRLRLIEGYFRFES